MMRRIMMKITMKITMKTWTKIMTRTTMKTMMKIMTRTMMKITTRTTMKTMMRIWMKMLMGHPEDVVEAVVAEAVEVVEDPEAAEGAAVEDPVALEDPELHAQLAQPDLLELQINKLIKEDFFVVLVLLIPDQDPIEDMMLIVVTSKINVNSPSPCTSHHHTCAVPPEEVAAADLAFHTDPCHSIPAEVEMPHAAFTEMFSKIAVQLPPWNLNPALLPAEVPLMSQ